jgi:hypothetical protein
MGIGPPVSASRLLMWTRVACQLQTAPRSTLFMATKAGQKPELIQGLPPTLLY